MFLHNFLPKTLLFYIFSSGGPCFVSCSFVFALLSLFCLGGAFSYTFKAFSSLGGPFSYIYFFFRPRPKPQSRGPLCFAKNTDYLHFFLGGPLFCFLFFCFCSFKAFLSLGGTFLIYTFFFRPRPKPQSRGPLCFCAIFCQKH